MKSLILSSLIIILSLMVFAQNRIASGYILDKESHIAIEGAIIRVNDTTISVFSNESGEFSVEVPRRRRALFVLKEDYFTQKIYLKPGFQHRPIRVYMTSGKSVIKANKKISTRDSLYGTYKNALTFSILELYLVAIGLRYERFVKYRHSIGLHVSYYIYGRSNLEPMQGGYYPLVSTYTGFKAVPFYRFYTLRRGTTGLFADLKAPFGYFYFDELQYKMSTNNYRSLSITHSFWTYGVGISAGIMFALPRTTHGTANLSIGYQYFPVVKGPDYLQEKFESGTVLTHRTKYDWWYLGGPGSSFELKLTLGGIF